MLTNDGAKGGGIVAIVVAVLMVVLNVTGEDETQVILDRMDLIASQLEEEIDYNREKINANGSEISVLALIVTQDETATEAKIEELESLLRENARGRFTETEDIIRTNAYLQAVREANPGLNIPNYPAQ